MTVLRAFVSGIGMAAVALAMLGLMVLLTGLVAAGILIAILETQ